MKKIFTLLFWAVLVSAVVLAKDKYTFATYEETIKKVQEGFGVGTTYTFDDELEKQIEFTGLTPVKSNSARQRIGEELIPFTEELFVLKISNKYYIVARHIFSDRTDVLFLTTYVESQNTATPKPLKPVLTFSSRSIAENYVSELEKNWTGHGMSDFQEAIGNRNYPSVSGLRVLKETKVTDTSRKVVVGNSKTYAVQILDKFYLLVVQTVSGKPDSYWLYYKK